MTDEPCLLIESDDLPVAEAFEEARRVLRGDSLVSRFLEADDEINDRVVAYMAECILANRPVSATYALHYLEYWDKFSGLIFQLVRLEESVLAQSVGEGVALDPRQIEVLQEAGAVFRDAPLAA